MSCSLIIHAPSSANKLQPSLIHQLPDSHLHGVRLLSPPSPEEGRLNIDESPLLVLQKSLDDTVNDVLDPSSLNVIPASVEILVHSLQPSHIIVSVGDKVDIEQARNYFGT